MAIVIIAHRMSTVRVADRIIVLKEGRVVEEGAWEVLSRRDTGVFSQLVAAGGET
jgi:ABC-type multidrug transport system fused ATPase/permease subunit